MIKVQSLLIALLISTNFCISQKSSIVVNLIPYGQSGYFICRGIDIQYQYQKEKYYGSLETGIVTSFKNLYDIFTEHLDENYYGYRTSDVHTSYRLNKKDSIHIENVKLGAVKLLKGGFNSLSQEFISIHFGVKKRFKNSKWGWNLGIGPRIGIERSSFNIDYDLDSTSVYNIYHNYRQVHEKFLFIRANLQSGINYSIKENISIGTRFSYARTLKNMFNHPFHDFFFSASLAVKI